MIPDELTEIEHALSEQNAAVWRRHAEDAEAELALLRERIRQYADRIAHFGGHVEIAEDLRGLAADPMKVPDVI